MRKEFVTLILILFCLFLFCGCIEHYDYKQYQVKVIDAEQDKPVGGASITIKYLGFKKPVLNPPKAIEVTTDANGSTELRIADYTVAIGAVSTDGYLPFRFSCHSKELIVNGKKGVMVKLLSQFIKNPPLRLKLLFLIIIADLLLCILFQPKSGFKRRLENDCFHTKFCRMVMCLFGQHRYSTI